MSAGSRRKRKASEVDCVPLYCGESNFGVLSSSQFNHYSSLETIYPSQMIRR